MTTTGPSVGQALKALARRLEDAGVPTPRVDAEGLLRHVTGWSSAVVRGRADDFLPLEAVERLERLAQRRAAREPLQLVLGTVGFRYLELETRPGVFIPRPETELLAGEVIARVPPGGVVVEPCTGAGAVACAVATESGAAQVTATDRSPEAVTLARENAERCGATVAVLEGDLLGPISPVLRGRVDVLAANPPYLAVGELEGLEPEVRRWDPPIALVAGPTGHEVSDRLIQAAGEWLTPGGWLVLEVDERRATEVAQHARAAGLCDVAVKADLAGRERVVVAMRSGALT